MTLRFYKGTPSWRHTVYVLGMPRSGKSTVLNVINSCRNVEAVDEPFELTVMVQKGSAHTVGSPIHDEYGDSFMASMENYFSELALGRRYNFRECDKSSIFNVKSGDEIAEAHARLRRLDVLDYAAKVDTTFALAFNDVEDGIDILMRDAPDPTVLWLRRDVAAVADEIARKGWLSDEQLSAQANVAPAYTQTVTRAGRKVFLPYFVREGEADDFLAMDEYGRSELYCLRQEEVMLKAMARHEPNALHLDFQRLLLDTDKAFEAVLRRLRLVPTDRTRALLAGLAAGR
jgi:hypothetical protein